MKGKILVMTRKELFHEGCQNSFKKFHLSALHMRLKFVAKAPLYGAIFVINCIQKKSQRPYRGRFLKVTQKMA